MAIIISGGISLPKGGQGNTYSSQYTGWPHLAAGLCCGLCCLAASRATGIVGKVGIMVTGLRAELSHAKNTQGMMGMGSTGEVVEEGDATIW